MTNDQTPTDLDELAPEVHLDASRMLFDQRRAKNRRRRRLLVSAAASLALVAGVVAVLQVDQTEQLAVEAGESAPPAAERAPQPATPAPIDGDVRFDVVAELEPNSAPSNKPIAATNQAELDSMWRQLGQPPGDGPDVDFERHVVLAATVPGSGCPSQLARLELAGADLNTEFLSQAGMCRLPLRLWTTIVSVDRTALPDEFTLVVPAGEPYGDDARLSVDLRPANDRSETRVAGYPQTVDEINGATVQIDAEDGPPAYVGLDAEFGLCAEARGVFLGCSATGDEQTLSDDFSIRTGAGPPERNESIDDAIDVVYALLPDGTDSVVLGYPDGSTDSGNAVISNDRSFWAAPVSNGKVPTTVTYLDDRTQVILQRPAE